MEKKKKKKVTVLLLRVYYLKILSVGANVWVMVLSHEIFAEMQGNSLGCPEEPGNDFGSLVPFR